MILATTNSARGAAPAAVCPPRLSPTHLSSRSVVHTYKRLVTFVRRSISSTIKARAAAAYFRAQVRALSGALASGMFVPLFRIISQCVSSSRYLKTKRSVLQIWRSARFFRRAVGGVPQRLQINIIFAARFPSRCFVECGREKFADRSCRVSFLLGRNAQVRRGDASLFELR